MNLIRFCVERPITVAVGVIWVLLFGLLALRTIPIQLTPTVDTTVITITTTWRGANPQEVEREIVDRQEEQLRVVAGVRKMKSTSSDGAASVTLEFNPEITKDEALRDVLDKLNRVQGYPLDMDEPSVAAADTARDSEIAWLILFATDGNDAELPKLRDFAIDEIKPYLDRVPGVGSTEVYGGQEREVQVKVDAGRLAARGLSFTQVAAALQRQNANISAGKRTQGKRDYAVRTVGQYESVDDILQTVIADTSGGPVYVRDIATVERTVRKQDSFVRSVGEYVLAFPVRREVGANVMRVMAGLREAIQTINREVLQGRGLKLDLRQVYDETVYISQAIELVRGNLIWGGLFTLAVIWLFLRDWRSTLIVALSIPISVIGAFVVFAALGRTLNVISLAGLAFAIGSVVDAAIVVLDNTLQHRRLGKTPMQAAIDATNEIWSAVLAGALTTVAVFLPVIFVQQEAGQLFRDISIATAVSVLLSVIVAITVVPALAARIGRGRTDEAPRDRAHEGWLVNFFGDLAEFFTRSIVGRGAAIFAFIFFCIVITPVLVPPATYLPAGNRNLIFGILATPPGYSIDEYKRMAAVIEGVMSPYWKAKEGSPEKRQLDERWVKQVAEREKKGQIPELKIPSPEEIAAMEAAAATQGAPKRNWWLQQRTEWFGLWPLLEYQRTKREWYTPPPLIEDFFYVPFGNVAFMGATSADDMRVAPLTKLMTGSLYTIPGVFGFFQQTNLFRFGGGNNVEVQVRGDKLEDVTSAAFMLQMAFMGRFGGYPQSDPANFSQGRPEYRIIPSRERAAELGLSARDVGFVVEASVDGAYVGDFRETDGDIVDLVLLIDGQRDRPTQEIGQIPLATPNGQIVPLSAAAEFVDTTSLEQINHIERQRAVSLTVEAPEAMPLDSVISAIRDEIVPELRNTGQIAPGVLVNLAGNADRLEEAKETMVGKWVGWNFESLTNLVGSRFFLSILVVYLLMAALFESWLYPLVMMFSVPMAIFGGFLGLTLARLGTLLTTDQPVQQLDVLTFLGFVILVGTVVNNGILLVDQYLIFVRHQGVPHREAIVEAVKARVRPVFMTSFTNVFGQLPLAVVPGAGSELYRGMAAVLVMGMFIATLGTLVLIPCILSLLPPPKRIG